jgi:hypothetical protein
MNQLTILLLLLALGAQPAHAWGHTLTVRLRDASGAGVPHIEVSVLTPEGTPLTKATTDTNGTAAFPQLAAARVRVQLRGALLDGRPIIQKGADAQGIALDLALIDHLELRAEPDGTILPDPATMLARESGDTAPLSVLAVARPSAVAVLASPTQADGDRPSPRGLSWQGIGLVVGLLAGLALAARALTRATGV